MSGLATQLYNVYQSVQYSSRALYIVTFASPGSRNIPEGKPACRYYPFKLVQLRCRLLSHNHPASLPNLAFRTQRSTHKPPRCAHCLKGPFKSCHFEIP